MKIDVTTTILVALLLLSAVLLYTLTEQHEVAYMLATGALGLAIPRGVTRTVAKLVPIAFVVGLVSSCGSTVQDYVRPAYIGTVETCRVLQERAVEKSETREVAELAVAEIRRRCDIAYSGIRVAGELAEELTSGDEDE